MPRSRLRVNQREPIRLDLAPAQAAYCAPPAPHQQQQPNHRDADRVLFLALAQDRIELRQIVRAGEPPARRAPVADDALARVPGGFGLMAPRDGAVEHVVQYVMTAIRAARLSASVLVEEARDVGAHDRADARMAERGQDRAVEVAHGGLHRFGLAERDPARRAASPPPRSGGDKTGDKRFYRRFVPLADRLYDEHIEELKEEGSIQ